MSTYFTLPTAIGRAMISNAIALGQQVDLTHMAIGDGNGQPVIPNEQMVELPGEKYRAPISDTQMNPDDPTQFYVDLVVPQSVGGWVGNCVGVYASNGALFAVANIPAAPKPIISEGAGRELTVRIYLAVENASVVNIVVNPTMVLATRDWAQREFWKKTDLVTQTHVYDHTSGRLMVVGAFGLGGINQYKHDLSSAGDFTQFFTQSVPVNAMDGMNTDGNWWHCLKMVSPDPNLSARPRALIGVKTHAAGGFPINPQLWIAQLAASGIPERIARVYDNKSIVGAVSQSAGTPTGSWIQKIINPNGVCFRFAGGLQICWRKNILPTANIGQEVYATGDWAAEFSSTPLQFALPITAVGSGYQGDIGLAEGNGTFGRPSRTQSVIVMYAYRNVTQQPVEYAVMGLGFWHE